MTRLGQTIAVRVAPGTTPNPDYTQLESLRYVDTDNVHFPWEGRLRSIPGWRCITLSGDGDTSFLGASRAMYSYESGNKERLIIGTSNRLYVYVDNTLHNITPVKTATTAIANSITNDYIALGTDPIAVTNGSRSVTITSASHKLGAGDNVTISGVSGSIGGVPDTDINTTHLVRSVDTNSFTIRVSTSATSDVSGGGASVVQSSAVLRIAATAHGMVDGDRTKILGATTVGGVPASEINAEHIIRNVDTDSFDIVSTTAATSSVSSGGGASTTYQKPMDSGYIDAAKGFGYGGGRYGVGRYGVGKAFVNISRRFPRIWSIAQFGNDVLMCAGNGSEVYIWDGDTSAAPTILTNAPTTVDWVYVSNNAVHTLYGRKIKTSDVGDATVWNPSAATLAYEDDVEAIGRFLSQAKSRNTNLLFTENEVLSFEYVSLPDFYDLGDGFKSDGLIAAKARIEVEEAVYWMGNRDFYMFDGGSFRKLENNTCRDYIFQNLNEAQKSKCFCRPDVKHNQIWWFFPTGTSNEPNEYVIYNYIDNHWTLGKMERTAAEEPYVIGSYPRMSYGASDTIVGAIYEHDYGHDNDGSPMTAYAVTNYAEIAQGDSTFEITSIIPDSSQSGNIDLEVYTKLWPQDSDENVSTAYAIDATTKKVDMRKVGRQRKYKISKDGLGEFFNIGAWKEVVKAGSRL